MDNLKVHAYTDDTGLTLFAVEWGDGRVLKFGAYVTDFELTTEHADMSSMFDNFRTLVRREQRINLEAQIVGAPMYEHPAPRRPIDARRAEIAPPRKELEP